MSVSLQQGGKHSKKRLTRQHRLVLLPPSLVMPRAALKLAFASAGRLHVVLSARLCRKD